MADAIAALPPGWRALSNNGTLITDGILSFFEAGTTTPLPVFADADLTIPLGTTVACNSAGYPVTSGNVKTLIWVGIAPYKVILSSVIQGGIVFEHDLIKGALDTSDFITSAIPANKSVVAESSNRSITVLDKGKLINVNCSAGTLTMTLDPAATLGDGFWVGIRHDGTANQVRIIGNGVDQFGLNGVNVVSFSLTGRGQVVYVVCNGTGFKVDGQVDALIGNTIGILTLADATNTPPGSPAPGARYMVGASPVGDWSAFAQHDIAEASGFGTWFRYTPPATSGWTAYVQSQDVFYSHRAGSVWSKHGALVGTNGLTITNNATTPTTQLDLVTTGRSILESTLGTGGVTTIAPQTLTIDAATVGVNGLDAGALAASTWYHIWLITNGATHGALLSLSSTAPTMPSGYVYRCRVGAWLTGGASTFHRLVIKGNTGQYRPTSGSVTTVFPALLTPGAGAFPQTITVANFYPPTATRARGVLKSQSTSTHIASIGSDNFLEMASTQSATGNTSIVCMFDIAIVGTTIFGGTTGGNAFLTATGWVDSVLAS